MATPQSNWGLSGWHVRHTGETGSTNHDLLEAARDGALPDRTVLVADHQTAGRGRLDRRWSAPPGANLLVSVYLAEPRWHPSTAVQMVGLAAVRAVLDLARAAVPVNVGVKWPNDLLMDGRKLAGVLAQRAVGAHASGVVIGLGLNVSWAPDDAICLHDLAELAHVTRPELLAAVLTELDAADGQPSGEVADEYRRRLLTLGHRVRVALPADKVIVGVAADLDAAGRLVVVDDDGAQHVLDVGDVVHLRLA